MAESVACDREHAFSARLWDSIGDIYRAILAHPFITGLTDGTLPAEAGRYRLVVARACPWANRAIIVRRLLGLEDVLSMGIAGPTHDERSWTFDLDPGGKDPLDSGDVVAANPHLHVPLTEAVLQGIARGHQSGPAIDAG